MCGVVGLVVNFSINKEHILCTSEQRTHKAATADVAASKHLERLVHILFVKFCISALPIIYY